MMDAVSIVAIIAGCSALLVAILTHVKTSSCRNGEFFLRTAESHTPTIQTPEGNFGNMIESVSRPATPVYKPSEPIQIPNVVTPQTIRKYYL